MRVQEAAVTSHTPDALVVYRLDEVPYRVAWDFQRRAERFLIDHAERRLAFLMLLEHPAVVTIGRSGKAEHVLADASELRAHGIEVIEANRGGDVTYHGPGQIVGYPILHLERHGRSVHRYLRDLEETVIRALAELDIVAARDPEYTGVWVGAEKIAAIGVAIRRWVTTHGFSLNVSPNMDHFQLIQPCGIRDRGVTSVQAVLGRAVERADVEDALVRAIEDVFDLELAEERATLELPE